MTHAQKGWLVCVIAACFFSYELVQLHMLNALAPHIMADLSLSATGLGVLSSTYLLADVIFLIPAGCLLDRFSVRAVILTALSLCIFGTLGFAFSQNLAQAAVSHFFSGIGNAFCFLSCMMLAKSWFRDKSTFVMSVMVTIGLLGGVIAQLPFTLLATAFNWRNALLIDAGIGVLIWILNYAIVKEPQPLADVKRPSWDLPALFHQIKKGAAVKETWICGFYTGLMNLPLMIISALMGNLFLTHVHQLDQKTASMVISAISLGTIMGSTVFGWIAQQLKVKKPLMAAGALASLTVFMFLMQPQPQSPLILGVLFFLLGLFTSSQVLGYPVITDAAPEEAKGTAMGLSAFVIMGLAFVLQPLTGWILDHSGLANQHYRPEDFMKALMVFPLAFVIAFFLSLILKEKKVALLARENG
jgi:MFS family permease